MGSDSIVHPGRSIEIVHLIRLVLRLVGLVPICHEIVVVVAIGLLLHEEGLLLHGQVVSIRVHRRHDIGVTGIALLAGIGLLLHEKSLLLHRCALIIKDVAHSIDLAVGRRAGVAARASLHQRLLPLLELLP